MIFSDFKSNCGHFYESEKQIVQLGLKTRNPSQMNNVRSLAKYCNIKRTFNLEKIIAIKGFS